MPVRLLTHAEEQVARLVAAGRSDDEAAAELGLPVSVAAALRSGVYRKLGARSPGEVSALLNRTTHDKEQT